MMGSVRRLGAGLGLAGLLVLAAPAVAQDGDRVPPCIDVSGEARYRGAGYHHVVIVENGCDQRARCEVWTDVTPEKQPVTVGAGERREVVTRIGSPAYRFTPHASCELED